jgi:hypothetical protein
MDEEVAHSDFVGITLEYLDYKQLGNLFGGTSISLLCPPGSILYMYMNILISILEK